MNTEVTCEKCGHKNQSVGAIQVGNGQVLQIKPIAEFRDLLSDEAKKVYDKPAFSTTEEMNECLDCAVRPIFGDAHAGHNVIRRAMFVQFLGGPVSVTYLAQRVSPIQHLLDHRVARRLRAMAHVFNRGVHEGWLGFSTLGPAVRIPFAQYDLQERAGVYVFVTALHDYALTENIENLADRGDVVKNWLNAKVGYYLFASEGEGGNEEAWDAYAKANNIA